jgi:DNA-binding protein WhiA
MLEMEFSPKESTRSGGHLIYFKRSEAIEDVLTTMGAPLAAMGIMQSKVTKDMNNAINRRVNCDSANADKIVSAAQEQLDVIRELDRKYGLFNLPEVLAQTAMLRIANPESSLTDLARLADPPVSKSCMSHRLKKLLSYKEEE